MLKLPEPLPYEFVDEMIDDTVRFAKDEWTDDDGEFYLWYATGWDGRTSNYGRKMFDLIQDVPAREYVYDKDGYITDWSGGVEVIYSDGGPTEYEIDHYFGRCGDATCRCNDE